MKLHNPGTCHKIKHDITGDHRPAMEETSFIRESKEAETKQVKDMISLGRKLSIVGLFLFDTLIHGALVFGWRGIK